MNAPVERFLRLGLRSAWVLLDDAAYVAELGDELLPYGWCIGRSADRLAEVMRWLDAGVAPPQLLVTGLRLPDGDALALMRRLALLPNPPAIYLVTRQQRAVIRAATGLGDLLGLAMCGSAEQPAAAAMVARELAAATPATAPAAASLRRARPPALSTAQVASLTGKDRIRVALQPKMRLSTGEIVGFEALMRGLADDGSLIPPVRLITPLETAGLLAEVTLTLMQQSTDFLMQCLNVGMPVSASINVPLGLMSDALFCSQLAQHVERAGLDPSWITLEITESDAMSEPARVIENTARIRMYGFKLSIDDFGTAYASFSHLMQLPVSELKIERAFVTGLQENPATQAMVGALAYLGTRLGLHVVAEGVETIDELNAVVAAGCTEAQGYLIGRPMLAPDALAWLMALPDQRLALCERDCADVHPHTTGV